MVVWKDELIMELQESPDVAPLSSRPRPSSRNPAVGESSDPATWKKGALIYCLAAVRIPLPT
jgi:hypothetical protein